MDQRSSFAKSLFGLEEDAPEADLAKMRDAKLVIYEGSTEPWRQAWRSAGPACSSTSTWVLRWPGGQG